MQAVIASSSAEAFGSFDEPLWAWFGLIGLLVVMLAIDLVRHRESHAPSTRDALIESSAWVACALVFAGVIWITLGSQAFGEYLSGYLIEKSLSVDNVFVWALLFSTMAIPLKYQHRVLFWGIFGALVMRGLFIAAGSKLIQSFWWVLLFFGVFLVYTGIKVIRHRDDEATEAKTPGLGLLRRIMPVTDTIEDQHFFTRLGGKRAATPLFAALVVIEISDVIFAVDSVPAILAVSHDAFIVFSSNAFAILGLRAMYFLLANARENFHYLSHGLGGILIFVGVKMTISHWVHIDTYMSLGIIVAMLGAAVYLSIRRNRDETAARAVAEPPSRRS